MMGKHFIPGYLFALALIYTGTAYAQTDSAGRQPKKVEAGLGIFYNSALNYYGRTDSLRSSGLFMLAELWFGKRFFISAAPVFVQNKTTRFAYAGTVATMGYRYIREKKYMANLSLVKPLYTGESVLVQSALKGQLNASFSWLNKIMNLTAGADLKYSDAMDYGVMAGLDHLFRFEPGKGSVLVLDPSVNLHAGTQRFSKTYAERRHFLFLPGSEYTVTDHISRFRTLSVEFSMPVIFAKGKFRLIANPAYVIPQNLLQAAEAGTAEQGRSLFYLTIGGKFVWQ